MIGLSFSSTGIWANLRFLQTLLWFTLLGSLVVLNATNFWSYLWHFPHAFALMGLTLTLDWYGICRPVTALWRLPMTIFTKRSLRFCSRLSLLAALYLHAEQYMAIAPASFDAHVTIVLKCIAFVFALHFLLRFWTSVYFEYYKLLKCNSLAGQLKFATFFMLLKAVAAADSSKTGSMPTWQAKDGLAHYDKFYKLFKSFLATKNMLCFFTTVSLLPNKFPTPSQPPLLGCADKEAFASFQIQALAFLVLALQSYELLSEVIQDATQYSTAMNMLDTYLHGDKDTEIMAELSSLIQLLGDRNTPESSMVPLLRKVVAANKQIKSLDADLALSEKQLYSFMMATLRNSTGIKVAMCFQLLKANSGPKTCLHVITQV